MNIYSIAHSALVTMILDTTTSSINDPNKLAVVRLAATVHVAASALVSML